MKIKLDDIDAPRFVYGGVVDYFARRLASGLSVPPLLVQRDVANNRWRLVDGANRYAALKHAGATEAECEILHPHGTAPDK